MSGAAGLFALVAGAALKGAGLLVVGGLCALASRRRSAAQRHLVWWVALMGLLALPAGSALLPSWQAPALSGWMSAASWRSPDEASSNGVPVRAALRESAAEDAAAPGEPEGRGVGSRELEAEVAASAGAVAGAVALGAADETGSRPGRVDDAATAGTRGNADGRGPLAAWLLAGWGVGAFFVLLGLAAERRRVARLGRRARPVRPDDRVARVARRMADHIGVRRLPRLRIGDPGAMPMTWGVRRPVLLLPSEAEGWRDSRLEAVLLHELAHVRRRDYLTQVVATIACAIHWFDPLAWLALGRLRRERELACDDEVLAAGARPSGYASELLELARGLRTARATSMAALAMASPSQLSGRLVAVLDETRERTPLTRRLLGRAAALALVAFVPLATLGPATRAGAAVADPSVADPTVEAPAAEGGARPDHAVPTRSPDGARSDAPPPAPAQEARPWLPASTPRCADPEVATSRRVNERTVGWTISLLGEDCRFELELTRRERDIVRGEPGAPIELDPTFRRIVRLAPGTTLQIRSEDDRQGTSRRLDASPGPDDRPRFRYWRNGEEAGFDDEAAEWLAGALVPVLRHTGLQAEARTRYILGLAGVDGVLEEVGWIGSDRVEKAYLLALLDEADLDNAGLARVLRVATASIGSDRTMRDLVVNVVARRPRVLRGDGLAAFRQAARTVGSDSEQRAMLLAILDLQGGDPEVRGTLLASATDGIGSDSEMRTFLFRLAERYPSELAEPRYWSAAATIGSDSELRTVLLQLAESAITSGRALVPALEAARANIGSDGEMTTFLVRLVRGRPGVGSGATADVFWDCVDTIGSDSELSRALLALAAETDERETLAGALGAARRGLGSDGEMSRFLVAFARRHGVVARGALREAYLEAAATIGSESERMRTLAALGR